MIIIIIIINKHNKKNEKKNYLHKHPPPKFLKINLRYQITNRINRIK